MSLPTLTHLQFLVIALLLEGDSAGADLRTELAKRGHRKSLPAFYQFMARLEEAGAVKGRYEVRSLGGQTIKQRHYTLTGRGENAWQHTRDFYVQFPDCCHATA